MSLTANATLPSSSTAADGIVRLVHLDQLNFSIPDIVICLVIILLLVMLGASILGLGMVWRKKSDHTDMKRNQRIMIGLIMLLVVIQILGITSRTIYSSISASIVSRTQTFISTNHAQNSSIFLDAFVFGNSSFIITDAGVPYSDLIGLNICNSLELVFTLGNLVILMLTMTFIGNVFITTMGKVNGGKSFFGRGMGIASILFNVLTLIFCTIVTFDILSVSVLSSLFRLRLIENFQIYLYVIGFLIFFIQIVFQLVSIIAVSVKVLQMIERNQSRTKHKSSIMKQAFKKVVILQFTLSCSALLQIVAVAFGAVISEWKYFSLFYLVFNNLSILLFSVVSMTLYHPIFTFETAPPQQQTTLSTPHMSNSNSVHDKSEIIYNTSTTTV